MQGCRLKTSNTALYTSVVICNGVYLTKLHTKVVRCNSAKNVFNCTIQLCNLMLSYAIVPTEKVLNNRVNNRCQLQWSTWNLSSSMMHTKVVGAKVGNHTSKYKSQQAQ